MVFFTKVQDTFVHSALTVSASIRDRITSNGMSRSKPILPLQKLLTDILLLVMYVYTIQTKTKTTLNFGTYWHNVL